MRTAIPPIGEEGNEKDQSDEIQMMMVMLNQRGGKVLPYPNR